MDILKNENKEEEEEDEILNDEQINEDISRTPEEFNKFQEMDEERYINEKRDERLNQIKEKLNLNEEQLKTINYRLLQEFEVPEWVKISKENEKEYDKIEEVEIGGKEMRVRKHVNYKDDYDDDFFDDTISDKSILNRKRKKDISESGIDSYDIDNRSNKKKKFGSDTNSMRQSSQVDLSNYGDDKSRNNNVNINLGSNKVQIKINDDDDDDEEQDNTFKSDEKIHLNEDDEDEK
jgi:mRNA-degrading endonuclease HigB of HigAB toxin-antitoxin module